MAQTWICITRNWPPSTSYESLVCKYYARWDLREAFSRLLVEAPRLWLCTSRWGDVLMAQAGTV